MAKYVYDAWGKCTIVEDTSECGIATINPYRYRGYYYDSEIGMYYLQSRYYDSVVGRFVNGDEVVFCFVYSTGENYNLFCYCNNSTVSQIDPLGYSSFRYSYRWYIRLPPPSPRPHPKPYIPVAAFRLVFGSSYPISNLRDYSISSDTKTISVISCSPSAWIASSKTMGKAMASAMWAFGTCSVECPTTSSRFISSWNHAGKCVIIHTHGSPDGLYDEKNGSTPVIIKVDELKKMTRNNNIKFVMMTACSTAGGDANNNVAYWLSKRISAKGIVIANKYNVVGIDTSFAAFNSQKGWVVYQDGKVLRTEYQMPVTLTMSTAFNNFKRLV